MAPIDRDGCVLEFNPAAERTFGYSRLEVIGQSLTLLIPERLPVLETRRAVEADLARLR